MKSKIDYAKISRAVRNGAREGVEAALEVLAEASRQQVPVDQGDLRDSCRVEMEDDFEGSVVYDADYAIVQHERTDFAHPHGGKAKYLEDPANDSAVLNAMRKRLRAAFEDQMK